MVVFKFLERKCLRKNIKRNNEKLLEEGFVAMRYELAGNVTELRLNGRVLMIFGYGSKSRAAMDSVTALICLLKNLNAVDMPRLKEIAFESTLNSF